MDLNFSTIIVALIAGLVSLYGYRESRAGRRDAIVQQAAANKLNEEKQELETLRITIDNERAEADRAMVARDLARSEADREREHRMKVEAELRAEADLERTRRIECETSLRIAEEQHRRASRRYSEELATLASLVHDEVLMEAGRTQLAIEIAESKGDEP